jgi:hypothetical protein
MNIIILLVTNNPGSSIQKTAHQSKSASALFSLDQDAKVRELDASTRSLNKLAHATPEGYMIVIE